MCDCRRIMQLLAYSSLCYDKKDKHTRANANAIDVVSRLILAIFLEISSYPSPI
jgi:hypothetical protein